MLIEPTVAWLTFRQLFVRRRLIAAAVFALAPFALATIYRLSSPDDTDVLGALTSLYTEIAVGTLLPLAALVFGTTAFGGEIDEGTVVYLLVKPLPRWRVVLTKYLVAVGATATVMLPAIALPWLVVGPSAIPGIVPLGFAAGAAVGAVLYCALFLALGIVSRRSLVAGLVYLIGLEFVLSRTITGAKSLSIREFVLTVAQQVTASHTDLVDATVSLPTVWVTGSFILIGSLVVAVRRFQRYEIAERL
jgi:ABC-2 type transport system permease protein